MTDVLSRDKEAVHALPSKRGKSPDEVVAVVVEIPDTPGALGQLFADVTAHGVNIEDVSIEHDPERQAGYLSVEVAREGADGLRRMLRERGWGLRS